MRKQKLYKPQTVFIDSGTYPFTILCFINQDNKTVEKTLLKYFDKKTIVEMNILNTNTAKTCYIPTAKNGKILVRFNDLHENCADCLPIITHEMFHVVTFLFNHIGIKHSNKSEEAFAYQLQYYCNKLLLKLK
ncbi:hypothetical protein A3F66_07050 [candidate division TM6 bacterium RIFCSPHIGHO2_12_FULL_32_22]|nr:MAG: hypothetical protein A3F66_07050 [candidate division TM6 bacterium RIFCSPHIGHO2_12_FULL_32_22]